VVNKGSVTISGENAEVTYRASFGATLVLIVWFGGLLAWEFVICFYSSKLPLGPALIGPRDDAGNGSYSSLFAPGADRHSARNRCGSGHEPVAWSSPRLRKLHGCEFGGKLGAFQTRKNFMRRLLRWIGIAVGSLVGLLIVAYAVIYFLSERILGRTYAIPSVNLSVPTDPESIQEGRRLATIRGASSAAMARMVRDA
jgi:hypothetical protein